MIRDTFVMRKNGRGKLRLVSKRRAAPLIARNDPRFNVIGDVMEPAKHMATGKWHDSKAKFRADTRATGLEEVGNDPSIRRPGKPQLERVTPYVERALHMLENGYRPNERG